MNHVVEAALALGSGLAFGAVVCVAGVESAGAQLAVLLGAAAVCWLASPLLTWLDIGTGHAAVELHHHR
ncbi:MAG: hypothetical protein H6733_13155 [Alphaproteobacteria bacterium]|nr:hypothetical protein [Alphaproteobacteria bacterium]